MQNPDHRGRFDSKALIYTPSPQPRWWRAPEAFWRNERSVFGNTRGYLEDHYPGSLKAFFAAVNVAESASFPDYARAVLALESEDPADEAVRARAEALYDHLWTHLREPAAVPPGGASSVETAREVRRRALWQQLRAARCWLGRTGRDGWGWHERTGLYLNDHDHNTSLFVGRLPFWALPALDGFARFLELAASSRAIIDFRAVGGQEGWIECSEWSERIRALAGLVADFLTSPSLVEERLVHEPPPFLSALRVVMVQSAEVTCTLGEVSVIDDTPLTSYLEVSPEGREATLWITEEAHESEYPDLIGDALSERLGARQLGSFVAQLLSAQDQERVLVRWRRKGLRCDPPAGAPAPPEPRADADAPAGREEQPSAPLAGSGQIAAADERFVPDDDAAWDETAASWFDTSPSALSPAAPRGSGGGVRLGRGGGWRGWRPGQGGRGRAGGAGHGYGGGGEGDVHKALKRVIRENPGCVGAGLQFVKEEYEIASGYAGSKVDVLLRDGDGKPVCVECKPSINPGEYGVVWQAIRYKHLLAVEHGLACSAIRGVLVAPHVPDDVKSKCDLMGVEYLEIPVQATP